MTDYYEDSGVPSTGAGLSSAVVRAEYALIEAGFAKIAAYTSNASKIVAINSAGTAQEAITSVAVAQGGTGATTAAGARTNLGLGSIATQDSDNVSITGGTISGLASLGVDNLVINGNDLYASSGNLTLNSGGSGSSVIYDSGVLVAQTDAAGLQIHDTSGDDPSLDFYQDDNSTRNAFIQAHSTSGLIIENEVHGTPITLRGEDAGGSLQSVFVADPDGAATVYYAGSARIATSSAGATITGDLIGLTSLTVDNLVANGNDIYSSSGDLTINSSGSNSVALFENGTVAFETTGTGVNVYDTSGDDPTINFYQDDESTRNAYISPEGNGQFEIRNLVDGGTVRLQQSDSGSIIRNLFIGDADGSVDLYYDGNLALATDATGLFVYDTSGDAPRISFIQDDGTSQNGRIQFDDTTGLTIRNEVNGLDVFLQSDDSGGSVRNLFSGEPDGAATVYYAGNAALSTRENGLDIFDSTGDDPILVFKQDSGTQNGLIIAEVGGDFNVRNNVHGGTLYLEGEDSGGVVRSLFVGDPDGAASLYYDGSLALSTDSTGISIYDTTGDDPIFGFYQDNGSTRNAFIRARTTTGLIIENEVHGLDVVFRSEDAGGTSQDLFVGDPDGSVDLYYDGSIASQTAPSGFNLIDASAGTGTELRFWDSAISSRRAIIEADTSSGLIIENEVHGTPVTIRGEDAVGSLQSILIGDPDGSVDLYYDGVLSAQTSATGFSFFDTSGDDPRISFYQDDLSTRNGFIEATSTGFVIESEVHGVNVAIRAEDFSGSLQNILVGDPDGAASLYYAGSTKASTASGGLTITGTLTADDVAVDNLTINGNTIASGSGDITLSPTGDVTVPNSNGDATQAGWIPGEVTGTASRDFNESDINNTVYSTSASDTYTVVTSLGYDGCIIQFITDSNASTIGEGASLTLTWKQGGSSSTGNRTIAAHSAITLYRTSSTSWFIWGNGIS